MNPQAMRLAALELAVNAHHGDTLGEARKFANFIEGPATITNKTSGETNFEPKGYLGDQKTKPFIPIPDPAGTGYHFYVEEESAGVMQEVLGRIVAHCEQEARRNRDNLSAFITGIEKQTKEWLDLQGGGRTASPGEAAAFGRAVMHSADTPPGTFHMALHQLKNGKRVRRLNWPSSIQWAQTQAQGSRPVLVNHKGERIYLDNADLFGEDWVVVQL